MAQHSSDGRPDNQEHDASQSASLVAMNLISSARVILKLDSVFTEYSAQYVVENATRKKEDRQGGTELKLSVKDCLEYALEEGIPRADCWPHLGSVIKTPSVYKPALVVTKGEVIEGKELEDLCELLEDQPVGAKLHVFSPDIDRRLGEDGIYVGPTSNESCYVGLRDAIVVGVEKIEGKIVARLKICYKKKVSFINVDLTSMFLRGSLVGDESQAIGPTGLLIDFCVPRLSTI